MKYVLYDYLPSGNGYKVRLLLSQLAIPFELVELDILKGESRTPEFLGKNPNGRIPVLELAENSYLSESHAIMWYLAENSDFVPPDRLARARVLQWLCFEQYNLEPNIAVARFWLHSLGKSAEELGKQLVTKTEKGYQALDVLELGLKEQNFLVDNRYSIADIGLYAYTHVADEGDFDLAPYPNIRGWIARVQTQPGYVAITER